VLVPETTAILPTVRLQTLRRRSLLLHGITSIFLICPSRLPQVRRGTTFRRSLVLTCAALKKRNLAAVNAFPILGATLVSSAAEGVAVLWRRAAALASATHILHPDQIQEASMYKTNAEDVQKR
jgi:hypothetical protein